MHTSEILFGALIAPEAPVKAAALQEVISTYGINIEDASKYEATIWVKHDKGRPLRVDAFRGSDPLAGTYVREMEMAELRFTEAQSRYVPPLSASEVRTLVIKSVGEAIVYLFPGPNGYPETPQENKVFSSISVSYPSSPLQPEKRKKDVAPGESKNATKALTKETEDSIKANRAKVIEMLVDAILAPTRAAQEGVSAGEHRVIDWNVLDPYQYLYIVMPAAEWEAQGESLKIAAVVHEKDKTDAAYGKLPVREIDTKEFTFGERIRHPLHGELVWAAVNLTRARHAMRSRNSAEDQ